MKAILRFYYITGSLRAYLEQRSEGNRLPFVVSSGASVATTYVFEINNNRFDKMEIASNNGGRSRACDNKRNNCETRCRLISSSSSSRLLRENEFYI